jgi:hypothetical protein
MAINKIKTNSISDSAVTSATIQDSAVTNAKISACAAIAQSKVSGLATSLSTLCSSATSLTGLINTNQYNIALLGFKMAITEGLTVFNLVDGIVDEFEDESGVDNSASTTLLYNSTDDYYINSTQPDGVSIPAVSAGFTTTSITEPDTSLAGANPGAGKGLYGSFTVPSGVTSINTYVWGSGGASGPVPTGSGGGGGGFVSGTLAVTPSQVFAVSVGEGGSRTPLAIGPIGIHLGGFGGVSPFNCTANPGVPSTDVTRYNVGGGNANSSPGAGGGLSGLFSPNPVSPQYHQLTSGLTAFIVAGSGGGGAYNDPNYQIGGGPGGGFGGGLNGGDGGSHTNNPVVAEGGSQSAGGAAGGNHAGRGAGQAGGFLFGGAATGALTGANPGNSSSGGGAGYFGGGGNSSDDSGAGGSSYYGHPQITGGATTSGQSGGIAAPVGAEGGGVPSPLYVAGTNEGAPALSGSAGEDGYVLLTATGVCASTTSSTIISDPFTANTVPTTTRIVVFEENVDTPSLNTDIIASVSRNGGTNFTNVTLADSGYVTGSSGQRILTGTATISGQPSGQSMKWKLQLANNTVKIHGVALQWS